MTRFSEGPVVEVTTEIAASPAAVWRFVTDIELPARFQDEFQGAHWLDGGAPGLGASFAGRNRRRSREWETKSTVVAFDPERAFGWAVGEQHEPGATWTFRLEPTSVGTELTFHRTLGPGPSGIRTMIAEDPEREEEIIARRDATHRSNMQAVLDGIKKLAEQE